MMAWVYFGLGVLAGVIGCYFLMIWMFKDLW